MGRAEQVPAKRERVGERDPVVGSNTLGLAAAFLLLSAVFVAAVAIGERLTADRRPLREAAGLYVWSIVPIALAYHFAHYLTSLLVNGQYGLPTCRGTRAG